MCTSMALLFGPIIAFTIGLIWEPLEHFIISPALSKFGIDFGYETVRNSLADIFFDAVGVGLGIIILVNIN